MGQSVIVFKKRTRNIKFLAFAEIVVGRRSTADSFFAILLLGLLVVGIYLDKTRPKADGSKSSEIEVIGAENKNTILFGTPPHEMEGRLSDRLRSLMAVPSEGHREEPHASEGLLKLFERSRSQPRVSVLRVFEDIENERTGNTPQ